MKAVLLIRVSDPRQEREGLSLDNQEEVLRRYAEAHGFAIEREFRFQESADRKIRTRFMEMISFVKAREDVQAIIAYRVDRMTRNYRDHVLMDDLRLDYDKELHFVYDHLVITRRTVGRDIQDWDTKVFLAKQFINRLKEDAITSAQYKLRRGEWPGKARYGYRNTKRDDGRNWIVVEPFEVGIVQQVYRWYATGASSLLTIRRRLKEEYAVETSTGMLDFILKNRFYYGEMEYDGKVYPHVYETIISRELFDQVQAVKRGYRRQPHKYAGLPFPYRGLIQCGNCGCAVTPERKRKNGVVYHYYHCTQYYGKHGAAYLREETLTQQFASLLNQMYIPELELAEIISILRTESQSSSTYTDTLRKQLKLDRDRYENRIERMYEDKLDGRVDGEFYEEKRQEYQSKQQEIEGKLKHLQDTENNYFPGAANLVVMASRIGELFRVAKHDQKRTILKSVLSNCVIKDGNVLPELKKPYASLIVYTSRQAWRPLVDAFRNQEIPLDSLSVPDALHSFEGGDLGLPTHESDRFLLDDRSF